jgi:iron complex outermembrane recepter protein
MSKFRGLSRWGMTINVAAATVVVGFSPTTFAQDSGLQLEEIVVTAEKRAVNLQKVATSIQVKSGEDLAKSGKKRIDEIMQGTPGIQAQSSVAGLTFFVRGVDAQSGQPGVVTQNPVAVLVDGVSMARLEAVRGGTLDVAQAEIMRGPQSTALGANAIAGAVSLVSNKPVLDQYIASGTLEVGNYHKRSTEGVFNAPLSANTALRLAYSSEKRDGYLSSNAGESDQYNVRGKFLWQPSANFTSVTTVSSQRIGGNGTTQNALLAYGYWQPYSATTSGDGMSNGIDCSSAPVPGAEVRGCPVNFYAVPGQGPSFRQRSNAWDDGFPANGFDGGPRFDTYINIFNEQIDWDVGIGTLTIQPAVQSAHTLAIEMPMGAGYMTRDQRETTTTLDVHLNSAEVTPLKYTAGLYYSYDQSHEVNGFIDYPGGGMGPPGSPCVGNGNHRCYSYEIIPHELQTNLAGYFNGEYSVLDNLRVVGGIRYAKDAFERTVMDAMSADGLANGPTYPLASSGTPINFWSSENAGGKKSESKATYRAGLEYDVTPNTMLYGVYSTGYTPGQYSLTLISAGPPGSPVTSAENSLNPAVTLKQITAGWKSEFLDKRLQVNGEFFQSTYFNRGVQGSIFVAANGLATSTNCTAPNTGGPPPPPSALNVYAAQSGATVIDYCAIVGQDTALVPRFVSKGLDLDATWLLSATDRVSLTYEYLKAQYDQAPVPTSGGVAADLSANGIIQAAAGSGVTIGQPDAQILSTKLHDYLNSFTGRQQQNAPVHSATLDYQHTFQFSNGSQLVPHVTATYKTKYWSAGGSGGISVSDILNDSSSKNLAWQQAYTKWDFNLGWTSADGKLGVNGYVKNLTNEVVLANYTYPYVSLEDPRTIGLIFSIKL